VRAAALLALVAALPLSCGHAKPGRPLALAGALPAASSSHVVTIVMENKEYGQIIGDADAAYVNRLARRYGLVS
jgi:phosphatidylinositol-3-phosphatase